MNPLENLIRETIAENGPMSLETYMTLALAHPVHGYYASKMPLGESGDFITAPEISQMFGELIGLWAAEVWRLAGAPAPMRLVELGPGRGTLMADALHAIHSIPALANAIDVHLVETSPRLIEIQRASLAKYDLPMHWHGSAADIPPGPAIFIANEFFDALPVQHFVRTDKGWFERLVGLDAKGTLTFGLGSSPIAEIDFAAPNGCVVEIGGKGCEIAEALAKRIASEGGALLVIDYGYPETQSGETLQAVREHRFVDPLEAPGECDLTAHVNFVALARAAEAGGAHAHGPITQAEFLLRLGITERARMLKRTATAAQAEAIEAALSRLTETRSPTAMGQLFKVIAITSASAQAMPGFI
jgi:NADH dehydrogenase [ubiquinone] 1 alpha subcomplex assembly factor 7